jgi:hypothetical protein
MMILVIIEGGSPMIFHTCVTSTHTREVSLGGTEHRCTLAAKSPLFGDRGIMAITSDDSVLWIDHEGNATPFNGPDSVQTPHP